MNLARLSDMLQTPEIIVPGFACEIPAAVVYSNAATIGLKSFANRTRQQTYLAARGVFEPVTLGRLPAGTRLLGGHTYWTETDGTCVIEQINPLTPDLQANYEGLNGLPFATELIETEAVLVARFGDVTWGHWVAEILPRAILAEHCYPGRFHFVVSDQVTGDHDYGRRVLESLAAYGITPDRLIRLRFDRHYRFQNLFGVSNIWSSGGMNPEVMRIMRDDIAPPPPSHSTGQLAILRRDSPTRNIANLDEITSLLLRRNFTIVDLAAQPFINQVAFFKDCHTVFGVLGSGFSGLIYAPEGVNVASVAPGGWEDFYFHGMIQLRHGSHADIRCPVLWTGEGLERDAPLFGIAAHITAGLDALATPEETRAPEGVLTVEGFRLHRRLGETILHCHFGESGMGQVFLGQGWAQQEPNHIWAIGPRSTMRIPRPFEADGLELHLEVLSLTEPDFVIARKLEIAVNGMQLGSFAVAGHARLACELPAACLGDDLMLDIAFAHPHCAAATGAADERQLALAFICLSIIRYAPLDPLRASPVSAGAISDAAYAMAGAAC